ncbi:hypothetical protein BaRGS_00004722 [Batillaria attramentaria]|uniref:Uncharacterized protein n=1 Tax=Batillaria attramentaria TaxID=370345 RepID=A0ABD0LWH9_9CAEN
MLPFSWPQSLCPFRPVSFSGGTKDKDMQSRRMLRSGLVSSSDADFFSFFFFASSQVASSRRGTFSLSPKSISGRRVPLSTPSSLPSPSPPTALSPPPLFCVCSLPVISLFYCPFSIPSGLEFLTFAPESRLTQQPILNSKQLVYML